MGRIIGLIGCTCLVITVLRLTNLTHVNTTTAKGGVERANAQEKLSPRQSFLKGKEYYLRGRYAAALPLLEQAVESTKGLSASERRRAEECLSATQTKLQALADNDGITASESKRSIVRGQSNAFDDESISNDSDADEAAKDKVRQLMIQAQAAYKNGNKAEAIRLAQLANHSARGANLKFSKDETTPGQFLAKLTAVKVDSAKRASDWSAYEADAKRSSPVRQVNGTDDDSGGIQFAGGTFGADDSSETAVGTAAPADDQPATPKDNAAALLAKAREDIKAGRFDIARRRVLEAQELGVTYALGDDRPDLVLAEIDRRTKTRTLTRNPRAKNAAVVEQNVDEQSDAEVAAIPDSDESNSDRKLRAMKLMKSAREFLKDGKLDLAQEKAEQAEKLRVAFQVFEESPDVVLKEIQERRAREKVARKNQSSGGQRDDDATKAKALLAKAKKALREGRLEEAKDLANKADQLKVAFGLFEESPQTVLNDIANVEKKAQQKSSAITGNEPNEVLALQKEALKLLREARKAMKEGLFDEAREKAAAVEQMDIDLPSNADSPDLVLADIEKVIAQKKLASKRAKTTKTAKSASPETDSGRGNSGKGARRENLVRVAASRSTDGEDIEVAEFSASGLTASELFDRGLAELNKNHRQIAYQAFKAAYDSGQKLDPVRNQQLNDYLRLLAPKNSRNGIQLASDQDEADESTPLDAAQQEQIVKVERLRTEVLNVVYKAEQSRESDPEKALELIDQTLSKVEGAELSTEASSPLIRQLNKERSSLRNQIEQQAPNLALKARNKDVTDRINGDLENKIRIDQDLAKLVDEYNDLYKQQRYADAELVAKKAELLNPKDPAVVTMKLKAQFARQDKFIQDLKSDKEDTRLRMFNDLERSMVHAVTDEHPLTYDSKTWERAGKRKDKYNGSGRVRSEEEIQIEKSLQKRISLHEDNTPLVDIINKIKSVADINITIDEAALEDVGVTSNTPVSIDVEHIRVQSALHLILNKFGLGYLYEDEVLQITNRQRQQGNLKTETYLVPDLVVPIPDYGDPGAGGLFGNGMNVHGTSPSVTSKDLAFGGQVFAQVGLNVNGGNANGFGTPVAPRHSDHERQKPSGRDLDFTSLTDLITSTIAPESWDQGGGEGTVRVSPGTLSLVIRQTQKVHEEIHDLLDQLRRLQDLQVTVEVRFVTVSDLFFERIGINFDFNIKPTVGYLNTDTTGLPIPSFGSPLLPQSGLQGAGLTTSGSTGGTTGTTSGTTTGGAAGAAGGAAGAAGGAAGAAGGAAGAAGGTTTSQFFYPQNGLRSTVNNPKNTTIVGLSAPQQFTNDLTIPFTQGSFNVGIPQFGGFNPAAGVQTGVAILSDLEAFFFIQAAQGDQRTNLLFAPKLTMFNGQTATVVDARQRPFVTGLTPTVGINAVGYTPTITTVPDGVQMTVTAVVSADRRFVRLSVIPRFSTITSVFSYQFAGGGAGAGGGGVGSQLGGGGAGGGFGGGQFGGGGGAGGFGGGAGGGGGQFGIGGGLGSMQVMQTLFTQQVGGAGGIGGGGGIAGGGGGAGGVAGGAGGGAAGGGTNAAAANGVGGQAVQQPVVETVTVLTTVSVPDGGTILLGGVKRLREGRTMAGVPILNKIPYVSRLFKNSGVGRETESLMLMVTPRIIIQEEEEEILGLTQQ